MDGLFPNCLMAQKEVFVPVSGTPIKALAACEK